MLINLLIDQTGRVVFYSDAEILSDKLQKIKTVVSNEDLVLLKQNNIAYFLKNKLVFVQNPIRAKELNVEGIKLLKTKIDQDKLEGKKIDINDVMGILEKLI